MSRTFRTRTALIAAVTTALVLPLAPAANAAPATPPPGLAKKAEEGNLPPGLQKQLDRGSAPVGLSSVLQGSSVVTPAPEVEDDVVPEGIFRAVLNVEYFGNEPEGPISAEQMASLTEFHFNAPLSEEFALDLTGIEYATNLRVIHIATNSWAPLPESLGELANLETLSLHGFRFSSNLEALPESVGNLTNLRALALSGHPNLTELPASLGNLTNLEFLEVGALQAYLPATILDLPNLERVVATNINEDDPVLAELAARGIYEEGYYLTEEDAARYGVPLR